MRPSEPTRAWQDEHHQRVLVEDLTAFSELCECALPHLEEFLGMHFPKTPHHMRSTVVIDMLLDYQRRPRQYDPRKLSLFAYFRMAAKRDMINAIDRRRRQERRLIDIEEIVVEFREWSRDLLIVGRDEELGAVVSFEDVLEALGDELSAVDEQILLLMLEGVRDGRRYAEVMQIAHLDVAAQRREVKRAKDRLTKKLQRFGKRLPGS
jgi:DNA-directed RNA polymerase specialized sigma24 family protein